jgi:hypothetical protein
MIEGAIRVHEDLLAVETNVLQLGHKLLEVGRRQREQKPVSGQICWSTHFLEKALSSFSFQEEAFLCRPSLLNEVAQMNADANSGQSSVAVGGPALALLLARSAQAGLVQMGLTSGRILSAPAAPSIADFDA